MKVECLNHWHEVSPTGLLLVVQAFQQGDLHTLKSSYPFPKGPVGVGRYAIVEPLCILNAFSDERVKDFQSRYHGHTISVDGNTLGERESNGKARS